MGVEKLALAAIIMATTRGLGSNPNDVANPMAIGVINTATALLLTNSVKTEEMRYIVSTIKNGGKEFIIGDIALAMRLTAPDDCKAAPTQSIAKINESNLPSIKENASSASIHFVIRTTVIPIIAKNKIGAIFKAAKITTANNVVIAIHA